MNIYNERFYNISRYSYVCNYILLGLIYSFSSDPRERNVYYDENFNITVNDRSASMSTEKATPRNFINYNPQKIIGSIFPSSTAYDLMLLFEHNNLIEDFLSEPDKIKQNEIKKQLEPHVDLTTAVCLSRFFVLYDKPTISGDLKTSLY